MIFKGINGCSIAMEVFQLKKENKKTKPSYTPARVIRLVSWKSEMNERINQAFHLIRNFQRESFLRN